MNAPSVTQSEILQAVEQAMLEVEKKQAKVRIAFGLNHTTDTKGLESSIRLRMLPARNKMDIWQTKPKVWDGPYTFISIDGETVIVQMKHGWLIFSSHCVKSYASPAWNKNDAENSETAMATTTNAANIRREKNGEQSALNFSRSRKEELRGLITKGTFETCRTLTRTDRRTQFFIAIH